MSKSKPTTPEMPAEQLNQNPPAEPREDEVTPEEAAAGDIRHHRLGLRDPIPSVRQAFAAAPAPIDPDAATADSPAYRGPWVVNNKFPMVDTNGQRTMVQATMPLPGGARGRRILEIGDISDALAQELWANGAISPKPLVAPKPRRARA